MENNVLLEMKDICKAFPGILALDHMSLTVSRGSVHALMGENGAGKSTLMKVLIGMIPRDSGEILFDGKPLHTKSISAVIEQGISMIHQELTPLENLPVYENLFCGKEATHIKGFLIDKKAMIDESKKLLEEVGMADIPPTRLVGELSPAQKQLLEIAKAVSYNSKLIIMDEPTSAIPEKECQMLFQIIRGLKEKGHSFIYITHKLDEVYQVCDTVTVMRDSKLIGTLPISEVDEGTLVKMMVGRELTSIYPKRPTEIGGPMLEVENLSVPGLIHNVSFTVRKGEILGVSGLMGSGRSEIMEAVFGCRKKAQGTVRLNGSPVKIKRPIDAIRLKIAFLTEDRKKTGCYLPLDVFNNVLAINWKSVGGVLRGRQNQTLCRQSIDRYSVKTTGMKQVINNLSGGNQQKVLIARWMTAEPDVIILDEPTRGIDVGSKHEIYEEIVKLAEAGKAVILVSSEMPEVLGMSDRIMVIHEGAVAGILDRKEANQEILLQYAAGLA